MFKKKIKQTLAIVLSIMVILCSFSTGVGAISVGDSATLKTEYSNVYYDYDGIAFGQLALMWVESDNTPLYCFEANKAASENNVSAKELTETAVWQRLSDKAQEGITRATIYGYPNFTYNSSAKDSQIVTQLIIWEFVLGKRTDYSTSTASLDKYITSGMTSSIKKCYQEILTKCANHRTYPDFETTYVELTGTGIDNAETLIDKNTVLSSFDSVTSNNPSICVSKNGNNLTIWSNSDAASGKIILKKSCTQKGTALALTGANQTMLYGSIDDSVSMEIFVSEAPAVACGDLNGDGKINLLDLVSMRKYLAKWNVNVDISAADCNKDDKINLLDLILLRKYLAKWSVTLGVSNAREAGC